MRALTIGQQVGLLFVGLFGVLLTVTGAVGLLDRVAPLCFAAPVFCHAVRWYFSVGAPR